MKVAVIGAGPSGLVTLKYLKQAHQSLGTQPIDARIFEAEAGVGGTFLARTYEDAEVEKTPFVHHHEMHLTDLSCSSYRPNN